MFVQWKRESLAVLPFAVLLGCGGGGGGDGSGSDPATGTDQAGSSSQVTSSIASVPVLGAFLAECADTGRAILMGFVQTAEVTPAGDALVTLEDALVDPDLAALPVIGGLVPSGDPAALDPVSEEAILMLLPAEGIDIDLPVLGTVPVSCDPNAFPLPGSGDTSDPTDALALIPVIGDSGDPVGVILAVVANVPGDGVPDLTSLELPDGTSILPESLGSAAADLLSLLGLLGL